MVFQCIVSMSQCSQWVMAMQMWCLVGFLCGFYALTQFAYAAAQPSQHGVSGTLPRWETRFVRICNILLSEYMNNKSQFLWICCCSEKVTGDGRLFGLGNMKPPLFSFPAVLPCFLYTNAFCTLIHCFLVSSVMNPLCYNYVSQ